MCLCGGFLGTLWINLTKGGELRWTLAIGNCLGAFLLYQTLTQIGPPLKYTYIFFGCFRIGIINQPPSYFHNQKQQISPPPILFTTNRCVHNPIFKRKFRASLVPASVSCQSLRITSTVSVNKKYHAILWSYRVCMYFSTFLNGYLKKETRILHTF